MKYIIDVPDTQEITYYAEHKMVSLKVNEGSVASEIYIDAEPYTEPDRKAIEDEVWEFATTCTKMDGSDSVDVFGGFSVDSFTKYSYQEAKAKYEEWKKQKDEIRVGDEVALQNGNFKYVVMGFHFNTAYLLASDGSVSKFPVSKLRKLNRHFNETEELLKKMREGKE